MLTFEQIKELMELVARRGLESLEIERTGFRLRIAGQSHVVAERSVGDPLPHSVESPVYQTAVNPGPTPVPLDGGALTAVEETEAATGDHTIASPIVGTFYAAPSPESDPYVEIGDSVRKGQVLCIIEAMKLMNEIESDLDGVVVEIYPKNAQPVEFGEPLFSIQPA